MRELPKDIKLEESVIGLICSEPDQFNQVASILNEDCFTIRLHKEIYNAIRSFDTIGEKFDILTVSDAVSSEFISKTRVYMDISSFEIISYSNLELHSLKLKELGMRRKAYQLLGNLATKSIDESVDFFETLNEMGFAVDSIESSIQSTTMQSVGEIMPDAIESIEKASGSKNGLVGIPSCIPAIDIPLSGFQPGKLIVMAGRPGMGKTALCLSIMLNMGIHVKEASLFVSLEMGKTELVNRLICNHCDISNEILKHGNLQDEDWNQLHGNIQPLIDSKIYIDDEPNLNLIRLKSKIRQAVLKHEVKVVFIDYLQLLDLPGDNRDQAIGVATRALKQYSKEFNISIVLLAQLSRACEIRADKRPILSDLRESGNIEQDADAVGFIYRDSYYNRDKPQDSMGNEVEVGFSEFIWAKVRNGEPGLQEMQFIGDKFRFQTYDV